MKEGILNDACPIILPVLICQARMFQIHQCYSLSLEK
jgi:hypothetical protein